MLGAWLQRRGPASFTMPHMDDRALREARTVTAIMVWGSHLEQAGNQTARRLTPGLNFRDLVLLGIVYDRGGEALPSQLVGPVFTTAPGVSSSLDRLEKAGMVTRGLGDDARTRPVALTPAAGELAAAIVGPWEAFVESRLSRLDEDERAELCRLVCKASGLWQDIWPEG
jgi:DNA-binding MarR family transcriptional regulator